MNGPRTRTSWRHRLVLLGALLAFVLPALAAPFGRLCLCLHGDVPVAVGACCCDVPPSPGCGDTGCADGSVCDPSVPCGGDGCDCVDLTSADDPFATADRRAEPLPPPDLVAAAVQSPAALVRDAVAALRAPLPPPDPADSPPPRPRFLRI